MNNKIRLKKSDRDYEKRAITSKYTKMKTYEYQSVKEKKLLLSKLKSDPKMVFLVVNAKVSMCDWTETMHRVVHRASCLHKWFRWELRRLNSETW